jgi:prepilin-type N-terminal cleavage/methylation domain-containing protein
MKQAFTLIELLVVVAILTILAAILFPVYRQARAASQKAVCVSHLRQVGLAATLYRDDWDGRYPLGAIHKGGGLWDRSWHNLLIPPLTPGLLACPLNRMEGLRTSYGVNRTVSGFGWSAGEWQVDDALWYVTEKQDFDWPAFPGSDYGHPAWKPLDPRHGGKLFALHLDGSVRLQRIEEIR